MAQEHRILARQACDRDRPFDRLRTSGAGFLGCFVVEKLRERGTADIFVPRKRDYDPSTLLRAGLVQREAVLQLLTDARLDRIISNDTMTRSLR